MQERYSADVVVDSQGSSCPQPIISLQNALRSAAPGAIIQLLATDRGSLYDIPAWVRVNKYQLLDQWESNAVYSFLVKK